MTLVGDTLNTASRMESTSLPSHVHATAAFYAGLPPQHQGLFVEREMEIKGKGLMKTYLLDVEGRAEAVRELGEGRSGYLGGKGGLGEGRGGCLGGKLGVEVPGTVRGRS